MIEYKVGNLLEAQETIIAHGCNAKGVMGSGVAKALRDKWSQVFDFYKQHEERYGLYLGGVHLVTVSENQMVANLITQENYGKDKNVVYADYDAIDDCFRMLNQVMKPEQTLAIPKIGAGLANGDWNTISNIIETRMPSREIICYVLDENEIP